ncbi:MAG: D-alanyl-D-alanine carboxypeptidase [Ruminococcus sp.]|nr:D-alanyl-D-alanine carboxypeptidase [Ruminococcus sp.]
MKRILSIILILLTVLISVPCYGAELSVSAGTAVLYCPFNSKVYYSLNENKHMKPASTTKIMTALITLEYAKANNKQVEFTEDMTAEGSSMYLRYGEVLTLKDLAVGILMCSGNDAANAAAISVAGSTEKFAEKMNERAQKIGMKHTHFVTPSGLDDENHYSTAYDMALLMAEALKNPEFSRLTAKKSETVKFIEPADKSVTYSNHNRLLSLYKYCIGGKTGYTMAAGRCLVSAAVKDGLTLIAVTMNDRNDWQDHAALYNRGFSNHAMRVLDDTDFYLDVPVVGGTEDSVIVSSEDCGGVVVSPADFHKIKRRIRLDNFLYSPIKKGQTLGTIEYFLKGQKIAKHKLYAMNNSN